MRPFILAAIAVATVSCVHPAEFEHTTGLKTGAWSVACGTERAELDRRFREESRALEASFDELGTCDGRDFVALQECSDYLNMWRSYHLAVRDLEDCKDDGRNAWTG